MVVAPSARISLLDGFALHLPDGRSGPPAEVPRAVQRLVAHVCLHRRRPRALVAGHLWPEVPEDHAHGSLRSALWRLQRIAPGLLTTAGDALSVADGVAVDVQEVDEWALRARDPRTDARELRVAPHRVDGDLLPGWYDDWVLVERERLRQTTLHALEVVAHRLADAGHHGEALEAAYAAVRMEPLRESAHRTLVRVHVAEGNLAEARRAYEAFRDLLADELGVAPSTQMVVLAARLPRPRRGPATGPGPTRPPRTAPEVALPPAPVVLRRRVPTPRTAVDAAD